MKAIWNFVSLIAVVGTYYGAWEHNWLIIIISAIPQFIKIGYDIAKAK